MFTHGEAMSVYANMASEELRTLAGMLDNAIQEAAVARKEVNDRKNGALFHASIRERVIVNDERVHGQRKAGLKLRVGPSDGIRVSTTASAIGIPLIARPKFARKAVEILSVDGAEDEQPEALFPEPNGYIRLFYTVADGRLGKLTLTRTRTHPNDYYLDCQVLDEEVIKPSALVGSTPVSQDTRNDADGLDGVVFRKNHHTPHEKYDEESTPDVDVSEGESDAG